MAPKIALAFLQKKIKKSTDNVRIMVFFGVIFCGPTNDLLTSGGKETALPLPYDSWLQRTPATPSADSSGY